jgi:hypothetical protein
LPRSFFDASQSRSISGLGPRFICQCLMSSNCLTQLHHLSNCRTSATHGDDATPRPSLDVNPTCLSVRSGPQHCVNTC